MATKQSKSLTDFAARAENLMAPQEMEPEAPKVPLDEVEPEADVAPAEVVFDLDAYLDSNETARKKIADDLSPYWRKDGIKVSYQGVSFRLRRGVPASLAFSGTVSVGDQTELALLVHKDDRTVFAEALVDDDRFLLSKRDTEESEKKGGKQSPAVTAWIDTRQILQALAMERDPKG